MGALDLSDLIKTLGSTAIAVAALGFLAKVMIRHIFSRDLERHKADLKRDADRELADAKARSELILLGQKAEFDKQMENFKVDLSKNTAASDRIRQEILRWANPILSSVDELHKRLQNILHQHAYFALTPGKREQLDPNWSIDSEYFLPSTVFLFCQYFCWVRLLEEHLSFELFKKQDEKDKFFEQIRTVGRQLSAYPLTAPPNISAESDQQIFTLQQRALGEVLIVSEGGTLRCLRYSEFLGRFRDPTCEEMIWPILSFLDNLQPTSGQRWTRLTLMANELESLGRHCRELLVVES